MTEIPDYFSELQGWRKFNVRGPVSQRVLVSVNHPTPWPDVDPGPAVCLDDGSAQLGVTVQKHSGDEPCPALHCSCGYYAYSSRDDAEKHSQGVVLADVRLWGRCIEHARGYRAERVRIVALHVLRGFSDATSLEHRYQVPVIREEKNAWISEMPDVSSLLSQYQNHHNQSGSSLFNLPALQNALNQYKSQFTQATSILNVWNDWTQMTNEVRANEAKATKEREEREAERLKWL